VVAADIDTHLLRELVGDLGMFRGEEMEDNTGSELSELESSVVGGMEVGEKTGQPNFLRAATGADRWVKSNQEFFRHGARLSAGGINIFDTPGKTPMRGALAHSLSAATSSPQQVGTAETMYSAKGSGEEVVMEGSKVLEGSKGVEGMDVAADEWVEEVANQSEDEMEGVTGPDGSTTPTPTPVLWPVPTPVLVTPSRGSKRMAMAMGMPRPDRHSRPTALAQILTVIARVERKVESVERKMEARVQALDSFMMEGITAVVADADAQAIAIMADAEERERRLATELLSVRAIETGMLERVTWEMEQWGKLSDIMGLRREDIREIKRSTNQIAATVAGLRVTPPAAPDTREGVVAKRESTRVATPMSMEGVVATAPPTLEEDPVEKWEDIVGVEREGLFALQHAPEMGMPAVAPAAMEEEKEKEKRTQKKKNKTKAVPIVTVLDMTIGPARKPRGSQQQQHCQAAADETRAAAVRNAAVPNPPPRVAAAAVPWSILKRPETAVAEERAKEVREVAKAAARERWSKADFNKGEEEAYGRASWALWGLARSDEEEAATRQVGHLAGMRAMEEEWEREWELSMARATASQVTPGGPTRNPQPQQQQQVQQQRSSPQQGQDRPAQWRV